jgi:hypothetical protein
MVGTGRRCFQTGNAPRGQLYYVGDVVPFITSKRLKPLRSSINYTAKASSGSFSSPRKMEQSAICLPSCKHAK